MITNNDCQLSLTYPSFMFTSFYLPCFSNKQFFTPLLPATRPPIVCKLFSPNKTADCIDFPFQPKFDDCI